MEGILVKRLEDAVGVWISLIDEEEEKKGENAENGDARRMKFGSRTRHKSQADVKETTPTPGVYDGVKPNLQPSVHEIIIRNQLMTVEPPLEVSRVNWVSAIV